MGYFRETLKGVSWMGALRLTTRALAFIKIALLARILGPFEFGLFGIASFILAFLEVLTETGINTFLIQEKNDIKSYLNSSWVVSMIRGVLISILLLILAFPISVFFRSPESLKIIILTSVIPFLRGFINPSIVNFQKKLQFDREFKFRVSVYIFDTITAFLLAQKLRSAESLVFGMMLGVTLELVLSWLIVRPIPKFTIEIIKVKKVVSRGKWITLAGIFDYLFHNIDDAFVGRLIGTSSLGLYQVAYKISTLPITEGGEIVNKVVFPIYTKISQDKKRLKRAYFKVLILTSVITVPFGIFLILFTEPFVLLFLGQKWLEVVPTLKVLAVFGVVRAISSSSYALFLAVKKQEYITVLNFVSILVLIAIIFPLINRLGILGAAYSSVIAAFLALPFMIYFSNKVLYGKGESKDLYS